VTRSSLAVILFVGAAVGIHRPAPLWAQDASGFAGRWTLNRELSQLPREIGFDAGLRPTSGSGEDSSTGGGRGGRGSGGAGRSAFTARRESEDDAKRMRQLTAEVRDPSAHLTVVETPTAITITDDRGQSRTFHPNGKEEVVQLDGVPVGVTATRDAGRLVVLYQVEEGRQLRYSYSPAASPRQLVVDVQFTEHGGGDKVRRVYEPSSASEPMVVPTAPPSPATPTPGAARPTQAFNQQPGAELKGLTTVGMVVEELSPQAAACGLNQGTLEQAVSKRLSDAGLKVLRNSDEDTYVYINVITTSLSTGLCVSRYDAFLYSHTTAKLSYQQTPVLVQVSLLHKGGIAGGASAAHAEGVLRGVQEYVDQFSTRIRNANK
jgi:hypothetical protein